ncbi:MAG TPA: FMN-binding protein [Candidatus Paceibacterota bacterium]|jgi:uncharacterized protein with FMN-binding domain|nr:FMN-binding protein [Candidatus Paceibacterota bacterium]
MKKFFLVAGLAIAFAGYAIFQKYGSTPVGGALADAGGGSGANDIAQPSLPGSVPDQSAPSSNNAPSSTPIPAPTEDSATGYKDGTYTGVVADAFYGPLQVSATITNGKIADIKFLKYPNDRPESIEVNTDSNPILEAEAIRSQSANVDVVSGATQSSEAFSQSLAAALAQARQ